jgi:hypothetical protein
MEGAMDKEKKRRDTGRDRRRTGTSNGGRTSSKDRFKKRGKGVDWRRYTVRLSPSARIIWTHTGDTSASFLNWHGLGWQRQGMDLPSKVFRDGDTGFQNRDFRERVSMKKTGTLTFALFVIVVLAAIFWLMHGRGQTQWGLVAVLLGVLVLRVGLFVINLRQQRHNAERGKGPVNIETRLGLSDDETETTESSSAPSPGAPKP